ncbi:protein of unknown function [Cyanobium sp. NIES-981]|nr:protein of unknown function [Cyanobium sp. NIES-981]
MPTGSYIRRLFIRLWYCLCVIPIGLKSLNDISLNALIVHVSVLSCSTSNAGHRLPADGYRKRSSEGTVNRRSQIRRIAVLELGILEHTCKLIVLVKVNVKSI